MQERIVSKNEAGQRLDKLLSKYLKLAPQGFLYKMLRKKNITLNAKKACGAERVAAGDVIRFFLSDETMEKFTKPTPRAPLNACPGGAGGLFESVKVYEDEHVILMNKPVGMLSQKAKETDISAVELLISYLLESGQLSVEELKTFRPSVCNRLDRNTSGLLAAGKSLAGLQELSRFFKERSIEKWYLCLVSGQIDEGGTMDGWIQKDKRTNKVRIRYLHEGLADEMAGFSQIQTEYVPLWHAKETTLLKVHLITGKSHQIRAHLASIGHPIIGDYKYGNRKINDRYRDAYGLRSQLLHAYELTMPQTKGPLSHLSGRTFKAEVPKLFREICEGQGISL